MALFKRSKSDIGVVVSWLGGGVAALALTAVLMSTSSGCTCTLVAWYEGLQVFVTPAWRDLAVGRYKVDVVADGEPIAMEIERTADGYRCVTADAACSVQRDLGKGRTLSLQIEYAFLVIGYSDEDGEDGGPKLAVVRVERDGVVLASETFRPRYERDEPNGRGCGVATHAQANLSLE